MTRIALFQTGQDLERQPEMSGRKPLSPPSGSASSSLGMTSPAAASTPGFNTTSTSQIRGRPPAPLPPQIPSSKSEQNILAPSGSAAGGPASGCGNAGAAAYDSEYLHSLLASVKSYQDRYQSGTLFASETDPGEAKRKYIEGLRKMRMEVERVLKVINGQAAAGSAAGAAGGGMRGSVSGDLRSDCGVSVGGGQDNGYGDEEECLYENTGPNSRFAAIFAGKDTRFLL